MPSLLSIPFLSLPKRFFLGENTNTKICRYVPERQRLFQVCSDGYRILLVRTTSHLYHRHRTTAFGRHNMPAPMFGLQWFWRCVFPGITDHYTYTILRVSQAFFLFSGSINKTTMFNSCNKQ